MNLHTVICLDNTIHFIIETNNILTAVKFFVTTQMYFIIDKKKYYYNIRFNK